MTVASIKPRNSTAPAAVTIISPVHLSFQVEETFYILSAFNEAKLRLVCVLVKLPRNVGNCVVNMQAKLARIPAQAYVVL